MTYRPNRVTVIETRASHRALMLRVLFLVTWSAVPAGAPWRRFCAE
jgi:hypothetical protein